MIRIYAYSHSGIKTDLSQCWEKLTWSGSKQSCARMAEVTLPSAETDKQLPKLEVGLGYRVQIFEEDKCLLDGFVTTLRESTAAGLKTVRVYDRGLAMNRNYAAYNFQNTTPEAAVRRVCGDFGIPVGDLPGTGSFALTRKFSGESLYRILATFYTKAAEKTGVDYFLRFDGVNFCVKTLQRREKSLVLQPGSNLIQADVTANAESIVNSVLVLDDSGSALFTEQDTESMRLYGAAQTTVKTSETVSAEAKKLLADRKDPSRQVTVTALGNTGLVSGETVIVREPYTGLEDVFAIAADTHTWVNGAYTCKLTLDLKNEMAEVDAGKEE